MLNSPMRGKWAQGIVPRNFHWILKGKLAVSERPGGHGPNHRPVRRMEEIIWLKQEEFSRVVSLLPSPHNLHAYSEHQVSSAHVPFGPHADPHAVLGELYPKLREWTGANEKVLIHLEEVGDRIMGVIGGYLVWSGMLPNVMQAINVVEQLLGRQMGSPGRELVAVATRVAGSAVPPVEETPLDLGPLPPPERKVRKPATAKKRSASRSSGSATGAATGKGASKKAVIKKAGGGKATGKSTAAGKSASPKKAAATKKAGSAKKAASTAKVTAKKAAGTKPATKKAPAAKKTASRKAPAKNTAKKAPAKKAPAKKRSSRSA